MYKIENILMKSASLENQYLKKRIQQPLETLDVHFLVMVVFSTNIVF